MESISIKDSSPMTFQVISSQGSLEVDELTGKVVRCIIRKDEDNELKNIIAFDVQEFRRFYGLRKIEGTIDILRIGYRTKDDHYEPPVADGRDSN